jgi:hypothetical protein
MFNRYAYANNNPYKYVDPEGTRSKEASGFWETIYLNQTKSPSDAPIQEDTLGGKAIQEVTMPVIKPVGKAAKAVGNGGNDVAMGAASNAPVDLLPQYIIDYKPVYPYWYKAGDIGAEIGVGAVVGGGTAFIYRKFGPEVIARIGLALSDETAVVTAVGGKSVYKASTSLSQTVKISPKLQTTHLPKQ